MNLITDLPSHDFYLNDILVRPQFNQMIVDGQEVRLEPKAMETLVLLVTHEGQVVTREQILSEVWRDQCVGDEVITRVIFELRKVFSDNAKRPQYIATISKKGYRCLVNAVGVETASATILQQPHHSFRIGWFIGAISLLFFLCSWLLYNQLAKEQDNLTHVLSEPETYLQGIEQDPSVSSDGKWLAFAHKTYQSNQFHLYLKNLNSQEITQLTFGDSSERFPLWSKDGKSIIYLRHHKDNYSIEKRNLVSGTETTIHSQKRQIKNLAWSQSRNIIVFAMSIAKSADATRFMLLDLETQSVERLFNDVNELWYIESSPIFDPSGNNLFFGRSELWQRTNIYVYDFVSKKLSELFKDNILIGSFSFTESGNELLLTLKKDSQWGIWRLKLGNLQLSPVYINNNDYIVEDPFVTPDGERLYYVSRRNQYNIMQHDLSSANSHPRTLINSSGIDYEAEYSHSRKQLAFVSKRTGHAEIWLSDQEGKNQYRLTQLKLEIITAPLWSNDDAKIAFSGKIDNTPYIIVVNSHSGKIEKKIELDQNQDQILLGWSADNQSFLIASGKSDNFKISRLKLDGEVLQPLIENAGLVAAESSDGRYLYYDRYQNYEIRRFNLTNGEDQLVASNIRIKWYFSTIFSDEFLYFVNNQNQLYRLGLKSAETSLISDKLPADSIISDIDKDSQRILFYSRISNESEIRSLALMAEE